MKPTAPTAPRTDPPACHQTVDIAIDCRATPPRVTMNKLGPIRWSDCKSVTINYNHVAASSGTALVHIPSTDFLHFTGQSPEVHVAELAPGQSVEVTATRDGKNVIYVYADCGGTTAPPTDGAVSVIMIDP